MSDPFFLAIFRHYWAWEPNLHSKISDFDFFSVSFDFLHEITLEAIDIDNVACWVFRTMFFTLGPLRNLEVFGTEVVTWKLVGDYCVYFHMKQGGIAKSWL